MPLEEGPVRIAEVPALPTKPLERLAGDDHGHGLAATGQFDFSTSFGFVHDRRKA
jgi:hypothetical protein